MGMYKGTFPKRWLNALAVIGILTALAIIGWQVVWLNKQAGQDVSSIALLEICFGIYAIFLASTSFYVAQIESRNWLVVYTSMLIIGCFLDSVVLGYHVLSMNNWWPHDGCTYNCNGENSSHAFFSHAFMTCVSVVHLIINCNALLLCALTLRPDQWSDRIF